MKKSLVYSFLFCFILLMIGCSSSQKIDKIRKTGELKVFTNANFAPFEYIKGTEIVGVDIDLSNLIASELGVKAKILDCDFDGIISAISGGKADISVSAISIDEARKKEVDFSVPYFKSTQYLLLPKNSNIENFEELKGKRVAVALGYSGQAVIERENSEGVLKDDKAIVIYANNALDGSLDIVNGKLDALIMDEYVSKKIASENVKLKAIKLVYQNGQEISEEYGVVVGKGNDELLKIVNNSINKAISDGKVEESFLKHSM